MIIYLLYISAIFLIIFLIISLITDKNILGQYFLASSIICVSQLIILIFCISILDDLIYYKLEEKTFPILSIYYLSALLPSRK